MTECLHGSSIVWNPVPSSIYSLIARKNLKFSFTAVALNYNPSVVLEIMVHMSFKLNCGAQDDSVSFYRSQTHECLTAPSESFTVQRQSAHPMQYINYRSFYCRNGRCHQIFVFHCMHTYIHTYMHFYYVHTFLLWKLLWLWTHINFLQYNVIFLSLHFFLFHFHLFSKGFITNFIRHLLGESVLQKMVVCA